METTNIQHNFQHQNHQQNFGLLRFRSAPSSLLANFSDGVDSGSNKGNPIEGSASDSERLISRFMSYNSHTDSDSHPNLQEVVDKSQATATAGATAAASTGNRSSSQHGYSGSGLPPYYPRQSNNTNSSAVDGGSYGLLGSNLARQNSSPAGLFSHVSSQNDYAAMRGVGSYSSLNGNDGDVSQPSNRIKGQLSFSPRQPSPLGMMSDIRNESIVGCTPGDGKNGDARFRRPGFDYTSWIDSSSFVDNLTGMKRDRDDDEKLFSSIQSEKLGNRVHLLSHHLSLPKASSEVVAMEKYLQFQDAVPCRIRAKRGCATHPRSIAERVRRTRISERMRKLQELVPNMDKQTNTADMLDLAVDYIKDLQKQFKTLSDNRANCKCLSMQKSVSNQIV